MDSSKKMVWAGRYWGSGGALRQMQRELAPKLKSSKRRERAGAMSAMSSLHYSAAGNAAKVKAMAHSKFSPLRWLWFVRGLLHLGLALLYSNDVENELGLALMTAEQLDIRQSILRRFRRHDDALHCINVALARRHLSTHTKALLLIGRGEILDRMGNDDEALREFNSAHDLAVDFMHDEPNQASRVLRAVADHYARTGAPSEASEVRKLALRLAEESEAHDQIGKMGG